MKDRFILEIEVALIRDKADARQGLKSKRVVGVDVFRRTTTLRCLLEEMDSCGQFAFYRIQDLNHAGMAASHWHGNTFIP